jgi:hypothetical protein
MAAPSGFTSFAKARIYVEGPGRQISDKGITGFTEGKLGAKDGFFEFMFSPKEFTESYTAKWAEGGDQSKTVFKGYTRENLTLEAIFDSYSTANGPKDVRENRQGVVGGYALTNVLSTSASVIYGVKHLKSLLTPVENPKDSSTKVPPILVFQWGNFSYRGHLETLNIKYTMFLPDGVPVRAKVNMNLKAYMTDKEALGALGQEACRKVRTVVDGMRLDLVASSEMKDPAAWKEIARLNNIVDPLVFPLKADIGKQLIIPDVEVADG